MRDQPADDLHGLPPPARPLDHQEAADRIQAACRGGGGATILTKHYYTSDEKKNIWILHAVFLITIIDIANTLNFKISPSSISTEIQKHICPRVSWFSGKESS